MSIGSNVLGEFLKNTPRSEDGYLQISSNRRYHHDEQLYDAQYHISPHDYVAGEGLYSLVRNFGLSRRGAILELGCGTGRLSVGLLKYFDAEDIIITDASSDFLDLSRSKFKANNLPVPHLALLQFEDVGALPDDAFSLIVVRSALHHVDKYDQFLTEAAQKLVKGGAVIFQEPLFEGLFILGLVARSLQRQANDSDIAKDLKLLSDTMRFYCRTDVDKSLAEDKHAFKLVDILDAANSAGLNVKFFANRSFEDFVGEGSNFDYAKFAESYLKYCMSFNDKTVSFFMSKASDVLEYIAEVSGADRAPESSGVFVLTRAA